MAATGDWLAPTYNGEPFFDKPALFHVTSGRCRCACSGPTELAARIVPALAAVGADHRDGLVRRRGRRIRLALVAALLLAACPGVFGLARYAILDTLFTAFEFGGVALIAVAALRDRPRLQYAGYVLIALAVLTKGPLAIGLCGLTFVLALAVSAEARHQLLRLHWIERPGPRPCVVGAVVPLHVLALRSTRSCADT